MHHIRKTAGSVSLIPYGFRVQDLVRWLIKMMLPRGTPDFEFMLRLCNSEGFFAEACCRNNANGNREVVSNVDDIWCFNL